MYPVAEEEKNKAIIEAKLELAKWRAVRELIHNNKLALTISIMNIEIGVCNNLKLLTLVNYQIKQINKFLRGEPNEWE